MSEVEFTIFMTGVKRYYIQITKCLLKNVSLRNTILAYLRFLGPLSRNIISEKQIKRIAKKLPPSCHLKESDIDSISIEWKQLVLEEIPAEWTKDDVPIDTYWTNVFNIKVNSQIKYPNIKRVVTCCFSFAEANAAVERHFSQLGRIISKDRNRLDECTIKGLMSVKSTLTAAQKFCYNYPINDDMIIYTISTRSRYVHRLAEKRKPIDAPDDEELEREIQRKQADNLEKSKKFKQIKDDEEKNVFKENKFSEKHLEAMKLLKQAQELMKETQVLKEEIDVDRSKVEKEKKL